MTLRDISIDDTESLAAVSRIYHDSFPAEERRPWEGLLDILARDQRYRIIGAFAEDDALVGFITVWTFPQFAYVEHFAVSGDQRNSGIGRRILNRLTTEQPLPLILEVEPSGSGHMAERRIRFYQRCGFVPHPAFEYVQPSYATGLPEVPLMLMTTADMDLDHAAGVIKSEVYGMSQSHNKC